MVDMQNTICLCSFVFCTKRLGILRPGEPQMTAVVKKMTDEVNTFKL